jgi:hypothetical protein
MKQKKILTKPFYIPDRMIPVKKVSRRSESYTKYKNPREQEIFLPESISNAGAKDLERDSAKSMSPIQRKSAN